MPPKKKTSEDEEPRAQPAEDDQATEGTRSALGLKQLVKSHPPYATMVKEALRAQDSRKGVTSQAIRNYIKKNYPTVDVHRLTSMVRKVLIKKEESGELMHLENPKLSAVKKYRLVPTGKGAKQKGENTDPNVQKEAKAPKEGAKKTSKEGGKTKKSPSSEKQPQEEPKPEKKPKKDEVAKTSETTETTKQKRKKEAEKSPSAKPRTVKAPKVPKAAALAKSKAAKAASKSPPAAKPGRAKKNAQ